MMTENIHSFISMMKILFNNGNPIIIIINEIFNSMSMTNVNNIQCQWLIFNNHITMKEK